MTLSALTGNRLRARRVALGLRQGDVALRAGVSASYLNLIEHNRRRVPEPVLLRLSEVLDQPIAAFAEGPEGAVIDDLRATATVWPAGEALRVEEFAGRFPGWAQVILGMAQRIAALETAVEAVNDRMSHDPHLSANLHEVLSAVASVRSTAAILAGPEELDAEWQTRFLRNLDQDSARLALGADALVKYLDSGGQIEAQGMASPQEEVEAWADAADWQLAELDLPPALSRSARDMALALKKAVRADLVAIPAKEFERALAQDGMDALAMAARFGTDPMTAFRRLAFGAGAGLVTCDASGTLTLRKRISGFSLPRFGAACALWPLFSALAKPMVPIMQLVQTAGAAPQRFLIHAFCLPRYPAGFSGPELREAVMLILPNPKADVPALEIGSSCRVCPRMGCPARREPAILT
jgi:predicted transcriptional regulator/DNA-binding XRE family transcriptional regulator